jgi:hypothetical protein
MWLGHELQWMREAALQLSGFTVATLFLLTQLWRGDLSPMDGKAVQNLHSRSDR